MHDIPSRGRATPFAAWAGDGRLLALVATGPAPADQEEEGTPEEVAGNPPPAERTPVDTVLDPPPDAAEFTIPVAVLEGFETADRRFIEAGALGRRALPWTLMAMRRNPDGGWGHDAAVTAGRIDTADRSSVAGQTNPETGEPYPEGVYAWRLGGWVVSDTDEAASTLGYIRDGVLRGVSVDISEGRSEIDVLEEDEDGWPIDYRERVTQGALMGATACPFAAFPGAWIELTGRTTDAQGTVTDPGQDSPPAVAASCGPTGVPLLARTATAAQWRALRARPVNLPAESDPAHRGTVVAAGGPVFPPAAFFTDPQLPGPTPSTITEQGRYFGHYACWGTEHIGLLGEHIVPEQLRSRTGHSLFHLGAVRTAEGTDVPVGQVTLGTGHASTTDPLMTAWRAIEHYDNTGTVVADVVVGEDQYGMWFSGALRPGLTDEQVRVLRGAKLSGDWREPRPGAGSELVGLLCCNVPGFPIPRMQAVAASGRLIAVTAAGVSSVEKRATPDYERAITAAIRRELRPLNEQRGRLALQRIRGR